jgi:hypothetical protein
MSVLPSPDGKFVQCGPESRTTRAWPPTCEMLSTPTTLPGPSASATGEARRDGEEGRFEAALGGRFGWEHEYVVYPRENHSIRERNHQLDLLRRTREWFDRWLMRRPDVASS